MSDEAYFIRKVRSVADYQFGSGVGVKFFPDGVSLRFSRRTGRVRYVYLSGELLATLRPSDGLFSLTLKGAQRLMEIECSSGITVKVQGDISPIIERGRNVFAKHVISVSDEIRPGEEVIVVNPENKVLAVGKAILSGREMAYFRRGVAVRVRKGSAEKAKKPGRH